MKSAQEMFVKEIPLGRIVEVRQVVAAGSSVNSPKLLFYNLLAAYEFKYKKIPILKRSLLSSLSVRPDGFSMGTVIELHC